MIAIGFIDFSMAWILNYLSHRRRHRRRLNPLFSEVRLNQMLIRLPLLNLVYRFNLRCPIFDFFVLIILIIIIMCWCRNDQQ